MDKKNKVIESVKNMQAADFDSNWMESVGLGYELAKHVNEKELMLLLIQDTEFSRTWHSHPILRTAYRQSSKNHDRKDLHSQ